MTQISQSILLYFILSLNYHLLIFAPYKFNGIVNMIFHTSYTSKNYNLLL